MRPLDDQLAGLECSNMPARDSGEEESDVIHVAVDARPFSEINNGIRRSTERLVQELLLLPQLKISLLSNRSFRDCSFIGDQNIYYDKPWRQVPGSLWGELRMLRIAESIGADVLWGTHNFLPRAKSNIPKVLTVHDMVYRRHPQTMKASNRFLSTLTGDASILHSDWIVCVSDFTRSELLGYFPDRANRTVTIKHGRLVQDCVDSSRPDLPAKFLFHVGSFEPRKNLHGLVDTFRILRERQPDLHLVLAGTVGWRNSEWFRRVRDDGLSNRIHVMERLSDGQIRCCMEQCIAMVLPSIYEGFGLPILESAGVAPRLILNDIPVFREVAAGLPNAHFVDFSDAVMAAEAVEAALVSPWSKDSPVPHSLYHRTWNQAALEYRTIFEQAMKASTKARM